MLSMVFALNEFLRGYSVIWLFYYVQFSWRIKRGATLSLMSLYFPFFSTCFKNSGNMVEVLLINKTLFTNQLVLFFLHNITIFYRQEIYFTERTIFEYFTNTKTLKIPFVHPLLWGSTRGDSWKYFRWLNLPDNKGTGFVYPIVVEFHALKMKTILQFNQDEGKQYF